MSCTLPAVSDAAIETGRGDGCAVIDRTVDDVSSPSALPAGTVTFVSTGIDLSAMAGTRHSEATSIAVARLHEIVADATAAWSGALPVQQGDGVVAVFARATDALAAALDVRFALHRESWPGRLADARPHRGAHR